MKVMDVEVNDDVNVKVKVDGSAPHMETNLDKTPSHNVKHTLSNADADAGGSDIPRR